MLQTRVVVGESEQGSSGMRDTTFKANGQQYDSLVDNVNKPSIFVVFPEAVAYPEYIIKFTQ